MKTYVYISDAKVDMYYSQIPKRFFEKLGTELSVELFGVKGSLKWDFEQNRISKLTAVVNYIEKNEEVGTVDKPKTFFRGKMSLRWGPAVNHNGVVFFGGGHKKNRCRIVRVT
jgi:hypothetical protein